MAIPFGGLATFEHRFEVPVDPERPRGLKLSLFAREVVSVDRVPHRERLPWLLFLQGGPGFPSPRPAGASGWIKRAVRDYRVLLLDQRGTGLSTPVTAASLARLRTPRERAAYLSHFRADSIVRDAEFIRRKLAGGAPWSLLGQSYGGFCSTHYLSAAPQGLREVFITGGIPSLTRDADDVYRATYPLVAEKNRRYYERYPEDVDRIRKLVEHLDRVEVKMPSGERLTSRRFRQLGFGFGMSDGFEPVHYLVEDAWDGDELSYAFLRGLENQQPFQTNPIFVVLHEACYAQGRATRWAASRVMGEFDEFRIRAGRPVYLTGEMIYPWMTQDYPFLRGMREEAELLAEKKDWPRLYDPAKLAKNGVPVAAAVYADDMYVPRAFSEESAAKIRGIKLWITNEYEHNGLRTDGERVVGRLMDMLQGRL
jgi:pimeloyl-ACP methyl ester carboxylesterase